MQTLDAYLPIDRRHALYHHLTLPDRMEGAALFADISGFTPLTMALANEMGRKRGAEQVLDYINPVYQALITELHDYGGIVICFSGDAITCWFKDTLRALACAFAMQAAMKQFATIYTPAGSPIALGVKVSVAAGSVRRFLVGNPAIHLLETLAGATLERMATAEHLAQKGEVVVDEQTYEQLNKLSLQSLSVSAWRSDSVSGQRFAVLDQQAVPVERAPWPALPPDAFRDAQVRPWLLPAVFAQLCSGDGFFGDLRPVSSLFLKFSGINYDEDAAAGEKLDAYINWVQAVVYQYDGSLLQLTIGDKGSNLFICFGAPISHEDDSYRVVSAALALQNPPKAFDELGKVQIGITRGEVWTGACGAAARHYYGVMGNAVNMAARLMTHARPGQILVSQPVAESTADRFLYRSLGDIEVKGRVEPLAVAEITGEVGRSAADHYEQRMIGRQAELDQLAAALAEVQTGQSRIICLEGEPGIGKSKLVSAFRDMLRDQGLVSFLGTGQSIEQNTSYRAWQDVLGLLLELVKEDPPEAQLSQVRQRVAQLAADQAPMVLRRLPLLNDILHLNIPDNELTAYLSSDLRQQSLVMLVLTLLRGWASQSPLCLILDDAQWLDPLSWALTVQVMRGLQFSQHPVLLLLSTRPMGEPDSTTSSAGAQSLAALRSMPGWQTLPIHALTPDETLTLIANRLGVAVDAVPVELNQLVLTRAEGNPFFTEELVNTLRDQNVIQIVSTSAEDLPEGIRRQCVIQGDLAQTSETLSEGLQGVILTRIDRLPPQRQAALKMAAVIGRSFAYLALQHVYRLGSPVADEYLLAELDNLIDQDLILAQSPQPNLAYVFKHVMTQEVAYQTLLFEQRKRIHRRVAEWYESIFSEPGQIAGYLTLLAHHYHYAEDREKEGYYASLAGEQAAQQGNHEAAAAYFKRALALTSDEANETRFRLLLAIEHAHDLLGARPLQVQDITALVNLAQSCGQRSKQAEAALRQANYAEATSDYSSAIAFAEQAVALAQAESEHDSKAMELAARGQIAWGDALRLQGSYAAAQTHLEQAVNILRAAGDARLLATALRKLGILARNLGKTELASACYSESLALSQAAHDLEGEAATLNNLGAAALKQGDFTQAQIHFQPALELYRELGDRRKLAGVLNNLALVAQAQGQLDLSQAYRQQALTIYGEIDDKQGEAMVLTNLGSTSARQGNQAQALSYHQQALDVYQKIGDRQGEAAALNNLGLVFVAQKDVEQAQTGFQQALAIYQAVGSRQGEANALSNLGAVAVSQGNKAQAQVYYNQALEIYRAIGNRQRETAILSALEGLLTSTQPNQV